MCGIWARKRSEQCQYMLCIIGGEAYIQVLMKVNE